MIVLVCSHSVPLTDGAGLNLSLDNNVVNSVQLKVLITLFVVPIDSTKGIKMLYVFVDIKLDASHFVDTVRYNLEAGTSLAIVSTIQFVATLQVCEMLDSIV